MPKRPIEIMKAISLFDTETDYQDQEARDKLASLFRELVLSDDPESREFFERFKKGVDNIIRDMGIIAKEEEPEDEVEMPDEEPIDEPAPEEPVAPEGDEEEEEADTEVPSELMGDSYRLISRANSFLNY